MIFQINTDFLINQLQKYFYTKHLTLLFHSNKKVVLSIAEGFRTIDFLPHFYLTLKMMRCAIFQINTDLVKGYEHINMLHKRLYNLPSFGRFSQDMSSFFFLKQFLVSVIEVFRSIHVTICLLVSIVGVL